MLANLIQFTSIFLLIILFIITYIGYGSLLAKFFFKNVIIRDLGQIGLLGCFTLIFIAYATSFFVAHNFTHNIIIIFFGILSFFLFKKNLELKQGKVLLLILVFSISFFLISKNHDDFPYYHLPYALSLSENKVPFGMGLLNYGFRHHSSLLFLSSLTYLPKVNFLLFNIPNYLIYLFVNLIILNEIFNNYKKKNFIFFISASFFLLINLKFTRLSEYGTDLAGQILLIIIVINFIKILVNKERIDLIYLNIALLLIIFSFKVYFILYFLIVPFIFYYFKINLIQSLKKNYKTLTLFSLFIIFFFVHNYINTGCLFYPMSMTCAGDKYIWSLSIEEINRLDLTLETWAKAGKRPNFEVADKLTYIQNINWVPTWYTKYFVGKVTDYLLVLTVTCIVIFVLFKNFIHIKKENIIDIRKFLILFFLGILLVWFFKHPSLRYGGYFPLSLIFIVIFSYFLREKPKKLHDNNKMILRIKLLIVLVIIVFNFKNFYRINHEINRTDQYRFSDFPFFTVIKKEYKPIKIEDKNYMYVADGYCWSTPTPCSNTERKAIIKNDYLFFIRNLDE